MEELKSFSNDFECVLKHYNDDIERLNAEDTPEFIEQRNDLSKNQKKKLLRKFHTRQQLKRRKIEAKEEAREVKSAATTTKDISKDEPTPTAESGCSEKRDDATPSGTKRFQPEPDMNKDDNKSNIGGNDTAETGNGDEDVARTSLLTKSKRIREEYYQRSQNYPTLAIDCDFEDLMMRHNIISVKQQVAHCYGTCKNAQSPSPLSLIGMGPGFTCELSKVNGVDVWPVQMTHKSIETLIEENELDKDKLVYLTGDSNEVLDQLDKDKTYILGGLVDRNSHIGVTLKKAEAMGIATARLPIKEAGVTLKTSSILTINQCLNMIIAYNATLDWQKAVLEAIPKRKIKTVDGKTIGDTEANNNEIKPEKPEANEKAEEENNPLVG